MRKDDIRQVLTAMGARTFKDSGESIMTNCILAPWTHEGGTDRKPSLGVKEEQGMSVCHCFTCGFKGGLVTLVRMYGHYAVPEGLLSEDDAKQLVDFIFVAEDEDVDVAPKIFEVVKPSDELVNAIGVWHDYFQSRGITEEFFKMWKLGYYEEHERIIFPVYDQSDLVGAVGRSISEDDSVKYKNYPTKFRKSHYLFGLNLIKSNTQSLIVVEGPIDAIKVNQYLYDPNDTSPYWAVAIMGSEPSKVQMDLLVQYSDEVICMLDNDASGKKGQKELLAGLGKRTIVSFVEYPEDTKDPDQVGDKVLDMIDSRVSSLEWQLKNILK